MNFVSLQSKETVANANWENKYNENNTNTPYSSCECQPPAVCTKGYNPNVRKMHKASSHQPKCCPWLHQKDPRRPGKGTASALCNSMFSNAQPGVMSYDLIPLWGKRLRAPVEREGAERWSQ